MTFKEFRKSRKTLSAKEFINDTGIDLYDIDCLKILTYRQTKTWISILSDRSYFLLLDRSYYSESTDSGLIKLEEKLYQFKK